jgi:hypothetical protein
MQVTSVSDITAAVKATLNNHPLTTEVLVEDSEIINAVAAKCPWIGIYRSRVQYPIRTLGNQAQSRYQNSDLILVCQATSLDSGASCAKAVETLVANAISALFDNQFLKANDNAPGLIDGWENVEVHYQNYTKVDNVFMQTVNLYITALNRTN